MPVAFVGSNSVINSSSGTSTAVPLPTSTAVGNMIYVMIASVANSPVPTAPSGWTMVSSYQPGTTLTSYLYRKVAVSGDNSATATWTWSANGRNLGVALAYSGVDSTVSTTVAQAWTHDIANGPLPAPALSADPGDWLVTVGVARENPGTGTAKDWTIDASGDVQRFDIGTAGLSTDIKLPLGWFDSGAAVAGGTTARTLAITPAMQQTHVWSILLPIPDSEVAGGNPWTHMGMPLR